MSDFLFIAMLVIHYVADFIFQTNEDAVNKWHSNKHLTSHVLTYSSFWFFAGIWYAVFTGNSLMILFGVITFIAHWSTDYVTSKFSHYYFEKKDYHNGFLVIGFDQVLHYVQLYFTYKLLK